MSTFFPYSQCWSTQKPWPSSTLDKSIFMFLYPPQKTGENTKLQKSLPVFYGSRPPFLYQSVFGNKAKTCSFCLIFCHFYIKIFRKRAKDKEKGDFCQNIQSSQSPFQNQLEQYCLQLGTNLFQNEQYVFSQHVFHLGSFAIQFLTKNRTQCEFLGTLSRLLKVFFTSKSTFLD